MYGSAVGSEAVYLRVTLRNHERSEGGAGHDGCSTKLFKSHVAQRALAEEKTTVSGYPTLSAATATTAVVPIVTARRSVYA